MKDEGGESNKDNWKIIHIICIETATKAQVLLPPPPPRQDTLHTLHDRVDTTHHMCAACGASCTCGSEGGRWGERKKPVLNERNYWMQTDLKALVGFLHLVFLSIPHPLHRVPPHHAPHKGHTVHTRLPGLCAVCTTGRALGPHVTKVQERSAHLRELDIPGHFVNICERINDFWQLSGFDLLNKANQNSQICPTQLLPFHPTMDDLAPETFIPDLTVRR